MNLYQHIEARLSRTLIQFTEVRSIQARNDQQDGIGAQRPGLINLVRVQREILAQHWQCTGGAGTLQVFICPLKKIDISEHRQAGRTARFVLRGDLCRVELLSDNAFTRAGLFYLGDHRGIARGNPRRQGLSESARRERLCSGGLHVR